MSDKNARQTKIAKYCTIFTKSGGLVDESEQKIGAGQVRVYVHRASILKAR